MTRSESWQMLKQQTSEVLCPAKVSLRNLGSTSGSVKQHRWLNMLREEKPVARQEDSGSAKATPRKGSRCISCMCQILDPLGFNVVPVRPASLNCTRASKRIQSSSWGPTNRSFESFESPQHRIYNTSQCCYTASLQRCIRLRLRAKTKQLNMRMKAVALQLQPAWSIVWLRNGIPELRKLKVGCSDS